MLTPSEKEKIVNKVKRFSFVIFLRRCLPYLFVFGGILLTFLLGLWNIRNIKYNKESLEYTDISKLEESFNDVKGKNIFFTNINDIEIAIKEKNSFIKNIEVKKNIPWTLELSIDEYIPRFGYIFNNKCNLYSDEGFKMYEVCENCAEECKSFSSEWKSIYVESNNVLDNEGVFMYSSEIGNIVKVLSEFGYYTDHLNIKDGIITLYTEGKYFVFDLNTDLNTQLARMYLVGKKINIDNIEFKSIDLRFERPVLKNS